MDKYCPDGQRCQSTACGGVRCQRFEFHGTTTFGTYDWPCPHCAAKDREIERLRAELDVTRETLDGLRVYPGREGGDG